MTGDGTDSGALAFTVPAATLGGLSGTRDIALGPATVSIGNKGVNTTYGGTLSGGNGLTKIGGGVLTLERQPELLRQHLHPDRHAAVAGRGRPAAHVRHHAGESQRLQNFHPGPE